MCYILLQQLLLCLWPASQALHQPARVAAPPPLTSPHHRFVHYSCYFYCFSVCTWLTRLGFCLFALFIISYMLSFFLSFGFCTMYSLSVSAAISCWGSAFACQSSGLPYSGGHWFSPQGLVWRGRQQQELVLLRHRWLCHGASSLHQ